MPDAEIKKIKSELKESSKVLLQNLENIEGEVDRIIDALKKEGISQAVIDLSFLSLLNLLDEQDQLIRKLAGIRKKKQPLSARGKKKLE
jgi:hypothetical protein